jgi:hypothetical protein
MMTADPAICGFAPTANDWNDLMNTHVTYIMAQERLTDFARHAAQARLGNQAPLADSTRMGAGWIGRALARLWFRAAGQRADAVIERQRPSVAG